MKRLLFALLLSTLSAFGAEEYLFAGKHFIASYLNCNKEALSNVQGALQAMEKAVLASGATILDRSSFVFEPNGLTVVHLLSESHASLHTYPEHRACFVDLFTCGDHCSAETFDAVMRAYLQPQKVSAKFFLRTDEIKELGAHSE